MSLNLNQSLLSFFLTVCLFLPNLSQAAPYCSTLIQRLSNSARLSSLETDSFERTAWIQAQNQKLNLSLKTTPVYKKISSWIRDLSDKQTVINSGVLLKNGHRLKIVNDGLGKEDKLILEKNNIESVLFSSFYFKKNGSFRFTDMKLSLDQKMVAVSYVEKGTTDDIRVFIFDLENKSCLHQACDSISINTRGFFWRGRTLIFEKDGFKKVNTRSNTLRITDFDWQVYEQTGSFLLGWNKGYTILTEKNEFRLPWALETKLISVDSDNIYISLKNNSDTTEIRKIKLPLSQDDLEGISLIKLKNTVVRAVEVKKDYLTLQTSLGKKQSLLVISKSGERLAQFDTPEGTSIKKVSMNGADKSMNVTLQSAVVEEKTFTYDLKKAEFKLTQKELLKEMMTKDGLEYVSHYQDITSADGTVLPIRITHLKTLKKDDKNPVFMDVYGGFGYTTFYPRYSVILADFLSRGGIIVDPAIRGGNEFGEAWHKAAMKKNKSATLEDLIATSEYLISNNYSSAQKIILTGSSNGGFVVAAAALKSPNSFGLVIPVNGVHDLLKKEDLDKNFSLGWSDEYGDSRQPKAHEYLTEISPVELATSTSNLPKFLIINGRQDSRVNPAHSFKLATALSENYPDQVLMTSVNNSGHWNQSVKYQGLIGWRVNVVIWTTIYNFLGWDR